MLAENEINTNSMIAEVRNLDKLYIPLCIKKPVYMIIAGKVIYNAVDIGEASMTNDNIRLNMETLHNIENIVYIYH